MESLFGIYLGFGFLLFTIVFRSIFALIVFFDAKKTFNKINVAIFWAISIFFFQIMGVFVYIIFRAIYTSSTNSLLKYSESAKSKKNTDYKDVDSGQKIEKETEEYSFKSGPVERY